MVFHVDDLESFFQVSNIEYNLIHKSGYTFDNPSNYILANNKSLVFIKNTKYDDFIYCLNQTQAKIIICSSLLNISDSLLNKLNKCLIQVSNPQLVFSKIAYKFFKEKHEFLIHNTALINPEAIIEDNVYIGPFCCIGKAVIKRNTVLDGRNYIYDNVEIGENCILQAGVILGNDGFGHIKDDNGIWNHFPHFGKVIIENNVQIGSNSIIARGSLNNTIISSGTKINMLVSIAHNVLVGENCFIASNVNINGSVEICNDVYIAPQATLRDNIIIGESAFIGLGAVVTKNVPSGETWVGNPAKQHRKRG